MKPGQNKIYFVTAQSREQALNNPFMEPFKVAGDNAPPVLVLVNNIDEVCFNQLNDYRGHRFVNVETSYEEIAKDLNIKDDESKPATDGN
jgi:HSP90 family molecular chaperone